MMRKTLLCAALAGALSGGLGLAHAQDATYNIRTLTPETALKAAQAALKSCRDGGFQVAVAVVNRSGLAHFTDIMKILGLDLADDSLADTPRRIAKMYVNEIFSGLDYRNFPKLTVVENKMRCDEMIRVGGISLSSTREHHFITIDGTATVAYIPRHKGIGLSKVNRIVAFFARRPQIQERLTEQVLLALQTLLESEDVAVSITATHFCVKARGVLDAGSETSTTALGGAFKLSPDTRKEFLMGLHAA